MIQKTSLLYQQIKKPVIRLLGVPIHNICLSESLRLAEKWLSDSSCHSVSTLNIEMLNLARTESRLKKALQESDLVLPDGISIVKAGLALGEFFSERIPGIDFSEGILQLLQNQKGSVYLLGGKPGIAIKAAEYLQSKYSGISVVGVRDGYFSDEEEASVLQGIIQAKPDVLFVGVGMGKQEILIHLYKSKQIAKIAVGVGGSLDVW